MSFIRRWFATNRYDVTPYTDDNVVDALLATSNEELPWLGRKHLLRASAYLRAHTL